MTAITFVFVRCCLFFPPSTMIMTCKGFIVYEMLVVINQNKVEVDKKIQEVYTSFKKTVKNVCTGTCVPLRHVFLHLPL